MELEPHPVSGEIEFQEIKNILYRRLDVETLQAKLEVDEFNLGMIYLWCTQDQQGATNGWKLTEMRALQDILDGGEWHESISEADDAAKESYYSVPRIDSARDSLNGTNGHAQYSTTAAVEDEDDDDYWASYDKTPATRTPAKRPSPGPPSTNIQMPSTSELEYFARYMSEVQPAADPHDPSEESLRPGESTLNGDELTSARRPQFEPTESTNLGPSGYDSSMPPATLANGAFHEEAHANDVNEIEHPRPASASSGSVDRLESAAAASSQAEIGVKQHISTDMKSLYRLAKSAGIEKDEFRRIVQTELQVLDLMDMDE